ncbi:MAG: hypothetical protein RLZZ450_6290 [Pseudomonadota bacterium]
MSAPDFSNLGKSSVCPLEARACLDDQLVAVSTNAVRVDRPGTTPILCFPVGDVRTKVSPEAGLLIAGVPDGYVAFDTAHTKVQVTLLDRVAGEPERDHTSVRFPTWGDASDLYRILSVLPDTDGGYLSVPRDTSPDPHRDVAEGSQLLAQTIVAAGRRAPERRVVSASMVFMRAANTSSPVRFSFDELQNGRSFSTLAPQVRQAGKLCASGIMLLDVTAPDVMRHAAEFPDTSGPYASEFFDEIVNSMTGRDLRFVDGAYTSDPDAPLGPPVIDAWVRFRDVPDDRHLHAALLAHFTGNVSIAAALRPHQGIGQSQAHRTLSTAINAINISFHADIRADKWMLYRHHSTFAGDGMTHSECRVYNCDKALVASFTVDAMVRSMPKARSGDARTAL